MIPVIVGPTGSGKTGVSIAIAKRIDGEIISADSRTVYKGMDVGTAKPTTGERDGVPHWGFDLIEPGERFTVRDWKIYAEDCIKDILSRGKTPIIVGGTGLYIDALVYDYKFEVVGKKYDSDRGHCTKNLDGELGTVTQNDLEKYPDRQKMSMQYKLFGIKWDSDELRKRLLKRSNNIFVHDLYEEVERLVQKYGWDNQAMKSNVYEYAWRYMRGDITREEAVRLNAVKDWHLAKRQMTWFKRNNNIVWLPLEKVYVDVLECIQDEQRK